MDFSGRHVMITGGSSGIGLAVAREFAARRASVSILARDRAKLDAAAADLRQLAAPVAAASADVSDCAAVSAAISSLTEALGPCDVLISSAGVAHPGYFESLSPAVFRQMMEVDYFGTLYPMQAVLPSMMKRRAGSIVAISSAAGVLGVFGYSAYSPAKFAVRGLMETLRQEMAPYGIHVGAAFPPDTDTPMLLQEEPFKPLETKKIAGMIPPLSATTVARAIVRGIERRRFAIFADWRTALLYRIEGLIEPLTAAQFDRKIRQARRERGAGDNPIG